MYISPSPFTQQSFTKLSLGLQGPT